MLNIAVFVAAAALALTLPELLRVRLRWVAWQRGGETLDAFERYFVGRGYPAELARATYVQLQRCAMVPGFPVRPNDSLLALYGLEPEDVADLLCVVAYTAQCGDVTDDDAFALGPVFTVEDAVRVLAPLYAAARAPVRRRAAAGGGLAGVIPRR